MDNVLTIFKHYTTLQTVQLSPARCYDAGDEEWEDKVQEEDIQLCGTSAVECSSAPNQDRRKHCILTKVKTLLFEGMEDLRKHANTYDESAFDPYCFRMLRNCTV